MFGDADKTERTVSRSEEEKSALVKTTYMRRSLAATLVTLTKSTSALVMSSRRPLTTVVWLRDELRVHDNALFDAAAESKAMVPVFCLSPDVYGATTEEGLAKVGAKRAKFVLECLEDLGGSLRMKGSDLLTFRDRPEVVVDTIVRELLESGDKDIQVVCAEGVCTEEQEEEKKVEAALKKHGVPLKRIWEKTMYHLEDVQKLPGQLPEDVFTSWRTKVEKVRTPVRAELPKKEKFPPLPAPAATRREVLPSLSDLGYDEAEAVCDMRGDFFGPVGGETAGLARLKRYLFDEDRLKDYFETRNHMIGQAYSSKLSPWLARGCISPRRVFWECQRYERERNIKNKSTYWLVFEMLWRDYFCFFARRHGPKLFWPSGVKNIGKHHKMSWLSSKSPEFLAFCRGDTGSPLVDANVEELKKTGHMSNRGRQNVASYLVLDLGVDWRLGAAFFESHLIDYTPESNWGNWHQAAGLGGGRLNKFNILKQSKDYDPDGNYVKLWLPALKKIPAPACFEPNKLNLADQARYDCTNYPAPINIQKRVAAAGQGHAGGNNNSRGKKNDRKRRVGTPRLQ